MLRYERLIIYFFLLFIRLWGERFSNYEDIWGGLFLYYFLFEFVINWGSSYYLLEL